MKTPFRRLPLLLLTAAVLGLDRLEAQSPQPLTHEAIPFRRRCPELYGLDRNGDRLLRIDLETGQASVVGPLGFNVSQTGMDFAPDGRLWIVSQRADDANNDWLFRVATPAGTSTSPLATPIAPLSQNLGGREVAFGSNCRYLYALQFDGTLFRISVPSGQVTMIGNVGTGSIIGFTRTPLGYLALDQTSNAVLETGVVVPSTMNPLPVSLGAQDYANLSFASSNGQLYALQRPGGVEELVRIDRRTGDASVIGPLDLAGTAVAALSFAPHR